ncbi:guaD, partial [Symbiodinium sp. KB8]
LGRAYIGVDRHTAAKYGFDDKVFYDEIDSKAGHYGIKRTGYIPNTSEAHNPQGERVFKNMVDVYDGILKEDVEQFFKDTTVNRTMRRRFTGKGGEQVQSAYKLVFDREAQLRPPPSGADDTNMEDHEKYMKLAMAVAARGAKAGLAKERECFGAVIVKDGVVVAEACNCVLSDRDATATAEVKAIRAATQRLGTNGAVTAVVIGSRPHTV